MWFPMVLQFGSLRFNEVVDLFIFFLVGIFITSLSSLRIA